MTVGLQNYFMTTDIRNKLKKIPESNKSGDDSELNQNLFTNDQLMSSFY